jgi:phospholipid-translocating ATPase
VLRFLTVGFVLITTIAKEGYDDFLRYKRDQEANSQKYSRLSAEGAFDVPSSRLRVGDIIKIEKNQKVPVLL